MTTPPTPPPPTGSWPWASKERRVAPATFKYLGVERRVAVPAKVLAPSKPTGKVYRVSYHYNDDSVDRRKKADPKYSGAERRVQSIFGRAISEEMRQNVFALDLPVGTSTKAAPPIDFAAILTANGIDKKHPGKLAIDGVVEITQNVIA